MQGIDKTLDDGGGITSNLEEIFKSINIFDNNIPILLNRFVSPLSSTLATTYYHYYIMDTLDVGGDKCVDLAFVPANSESYGFTGRLYITLDGNYAVKKVLLNTPANINLNWVDLLGQLRKVPAFNAIIKTAEILITGYIPTANDKKVTKFDFGPMNTTFSANHLEGFRMRVGGMTTANLNPYWFASGYLAYGTNDRKIKYNLKLTHSFTKKEYHEGENPVNNLSFIQEYDVYTPGQDFLFTSKDNIFVAWKVGEPVTKMQYIRKSVLQYEKEWLNGLTWKSWIMNQNNEAAGTLQYIKRDESGNLYHIKDFTTSEIGTQLRFAPGERAYNGRSGKESVFNLSKDAPVFKLSHQLGIKGVLGGDYNYNHTEISAEKRIWLSSFGHIDAQVKAGKVWDKVPFPLLILPNTNQSITIQPEAFHMMNALEFVTDQYVSFNATYYLKGWILNRIPGIKWLRLREVLSFNMIYGGLTDKNNPTLTPGLFLLPDGTQPLGSTPYMECSVGLENIFKILRIDYYRRLTYLDHPDIKKGGIRIALRFTF